jgi:hypothetical protein
VRKSLGLDEPALGERFVCCVVGLDGERCGSAGLGRMTSGEGGKASRCPYAVGSLFGMNTLAVLFKGRPLKSGAGSC